MTQANIFCAIACIVLFAAVPGRARAGNDDGLLLGNAAILSGGALTASVSDGSATWYNPAGLALVTRDSVDVSASAYQLQFGSTPVLLSSATGASTPGDYTDFVVVPSALTMARRLASNLVLGIGIFVPVMRAHDEQLALTENIPDGTADWSLVLRDNRQLYAVHLSLGVALTPTLRVGVGVFGNYDQDISSIHLFGLVTSPVGIDFVQTFGVRYAYGVGRIGALRFDLYPPPASTRPRSTSGAACISDVLAAHRQVGATWPSEPVETNASAT